MLLDVLRRSPSVDAFGEADERVMRDTRLISLELVQELAAASAVPTMVLKPICDSHYADHILRTLDGSRAIWIHRNYPDVINSSMRKWPGHASEVLARIYARDLVWLDWRGERLEPEWIEELTRVPRDELSEADASGLFWYLRNRVFFDRGLSDSDLVLSVGYERLVSDPERQFRQIFQFLDLPFDPTFIEGVRASSIGRASHPELHPYVAGLCSTLLERLAASTI